MPENDNEMIYRFMERPLEEDSVTPKTLDSKSRSVDIIVASDQAIREYDLRTESVIPTVILPEGIEVPKNKQVPLLDCHSRNSTSHVIGSVRNIRVESTEKSTNLVGTAVYASDKKSDRVFTLVREGHLTDYSIGAVGIRDVKYLKAGESEEFYGRTYHGPAKIIQRAVIQEASSCPIGADDIAKNRSITKEEGQNMSDTKKETPVVDVDIDEVKRLAIEEATKVATQAERARADEVSGLCRSLDMDEEFTKEVASLPVSEVKDRALKAIAERNKEVNVNTPLNRVDESKDKFNRGIEDGLMMRCNLLDVDASIDRRSVADQLTGYSLVEVCREMCRLNGQSHTGHQYDVITRAMSTSDFPLVLGNIARKTLLTSFDAADESYQKWADLSGNLKDFHIHTKARAGELGNLVETVEGEAVRYKGRTEQSETVQLATYTDGYKLTRKAIINDELSELTDAFEEFGEAVQRLYGDTAYNQLTTNPTMGDGTALIHANHGNSGTQGVISETTIDEMILKMKTQKDIGGLKKLNIKPHFILASAKQEGAAERFFASELFDNAATSTTRENIHQGKYTRIYDTRLDDYDSGDPWFALAKKKTVKMFFLNGKSAPFMEREKDFDTDSIKWKVRTDVGAMPVRWEGIFRNLGA